jgi:hypothetical protein
MTQSPSWQANSCSAGQEILCFLLSPKVHYCVNNSLILVPILSQKNPVHIFISYLRSILILFSHPCIGFPSDLFPLRFRTKILHTRLISPMCVTRSAHFILLDLTTVIVFCEVHK